MQKDLKGNIKRDLHRCIYTSSYDRGLQHLLEIWPEVKKEIPDATLVVCYGWNLFDIAHNGNPASMSWKEKMQKLMQQDGITELGRISHDALWIELLKSGVHSYPCHFGEISCISCMRSQAAGAWPVVTNWAALKETVQFGVKVEGDIYEPEVSEDYKQKLIDTLKNPPSDEERQKMIDWAKDTYKWSSVAKQWSNEFKTKISLEKQVEELMDDNQALKAWDLVKDTDSPIKEAVYSKVKHAFDKDAYKEFYSKHLPETPLPETYITQAENVYPRWDWFFKSIRDKKVKTMIDLGCADGVLSLTCAKNGITSTGVNLYQPSVTLANKRAKELNLNAKFICGDIFDQTGKYDAVVLMEVLEHLPDPQKAIDFCMSLVADGGSFYLSTPSTEHIGIQMHKDEPNHTGWNDSLPSGHLRLFTEEELKNLLVDYKIEQLVVDQEKCLLVEVKNV